MNITLCLLVLTKCKIVPLLTKCKIVPLLIKCKIAPVLTLYKSNYQAQTEGIWSPSHIPQPLFAQDKLFHLCSHKAKDLVHSTHNIHANKVIKGVKSCHLSKYNCISVVMYYLRAKPNNLGP